MEGAMNAKTLISRFGTALAAAAVALSALFAGTAAAQAADVFVTVFADHYVVNGRVIDDVGVLEGAILAMRPGAVRLYACGSGTDRAQMAAAHRFRDRYLELRVLDDSAPQCRASMASAPRAVSVVNRTGEPPYGIDNEAVARWWYSMMP
jgi:hypothetical protein